jgi:hypothetical protein
MRVGLSRALITTACFAAGLLALACGGGSEDTTTPGAGTTAQPVERPGSMSVAAADSPLQVARLDVAKRAGVAPLAVELTALYMRGFDGCNGVIPPPGMACTLQLGGGIAAIFRANGRNYRYHYVGGHVIGPIDPSLVAPESEPPAEIAPDLVGFLANYAREDFALRTKVPVGTLTVTGVEPRTFTDSCLGFTPTVAANCQPGQFPSALVRISSTASGEAAFYGVAATRGIVFYDPAHGSGAASIDSRIDTIELAMRQDLARRLVAPLTSISVVSYRLVDWPDGCLGVQRPGQVCAQVVAPGFLALLRDGMGNLYRYHGTGDAFIAATFETGARITIPRP